MTPFAQLEKQANRSVTKGISALSKLVRGGGDEIVEAAPRMAQNAPRNVTGKAFNAAGDDVLELAGPAGKDPYSLKKFLGSTGGKATLGAGALAAPVAGYGLGNSNGYSNGSQDGLNHGFQQGYSLAEMQAANNAPQDPGFLGRLAALFTGYGSSDQAKTAIQSQNHSTRNAYLQQLLERNAAS